MAEKWIKRGLNKFPGSLRFFGTYPWLGHGHIIHLRGFTGWLLNLGEELLTHLNHGTHFTVPPRDFIFFGSPFPLGTNKVDGLI